MNYRNFMAVSAIALMAAAPAWAQASRPAAHTGTTQSSTAQHMSQQDTNFMKTAAIGGKAEVELGKLAEQKANSPEVREFGRWMATDHSTLDDQLQQVAQKLDVQLPTKLDQKHQQMHDQLAGLSGERFDSAYIQDMLTAHRKDVSEFEKMAQSAQNPDLKNFAQRATPILKQHLAEAEQLASRLNVAQSNQTPAAKSGSSTPPHSTAMASGSSGRMRTQQNAATDAQTHQLNAQELNRLQP